MTAIAARKHVANLTPTRSTQTSSFQPTPQRPAPSWPGTVDSFQPAPRVAPGLPTSPNEARVKQALAALQKLLIASNGTITRSMIDTLVRGIANPRTTDAAGAEGVLTISSAVNAAKTISTIPAARRSVITQLAAMAGRNDPELERALLYKAVSARSVQLNSANPSIASAALNQLTAFAAKIRNRTTFELIDFTSVVDLNQYSAPEGLQQRFWMSCVATSFQIVKAEADPVYAWQLHGEQMEALNNPTGAIGQEQKRWLEAGGGSAVPRVTTQNGMGAGMWPERTIDAVLSETTHVRYTRHDMSTPQGRKSALSHLAGLLEQGYDVPIVAGPSTNHCMVLTDVRGELNNRKFLMQDPWTGESSWMSEAAMVQGNTRFGTMDDANVWITYDPSPL